MQKSKSYCKITIFDVGQNPTNVQCGEITDRNVKVPSLLVLPCNIIKACPDVVMYRALSLFLCTGIWLRGGYIWSRNKFNIELRSQNPCVVRRESAQRISQHYIWRGLQAVDTRRTQPPCTKNVNNNSILFIKTTFNYCNKC